MHFKPRGLQPHAIVLSYVLRLVLRGIARYKIFNVTVMDRENVPQTGRVILASNHISILDPLFLWGALRRNATALAMAELWRMPLIGQIMWLLGQIPVERGNPESAKLALRRSVRVLNCEGVVPIYPEGYVSRDGKIQRFQTGAARLAIATNAPIIPVRISGANVVKPLKSWRINRRAPVLLAFGEPIYVSDFTGRHRARDITVELRRRIMALPTVTTYKEGAA